MGRVVLITDSDTPLGGELTRRCAERGEQVVATTSGLSQPAAAGANPPPAASPPPAATLVEWRRRAPLSALNRLLSTLNAFDRVDEALVLNTPPGEKKLLHEIPLAGIEQALDHWVKGNLVLVREILRLFRRRKGGVLALINYSPLETGGILSPLESAIWGSFQAMTDSLLASYAEDAFILNGFESHAARPGEFAEFILSSLRSAADRQEKGGRITGRWFRFQVRSGLLSGLRIPLVGSA
jgi:NAD(P)-dependent dehydrogenase (short-subunit alcohol dehydrogenase family)